MAEGLKKHIKERIYEVENQIFNIDDKISKVLPHKSNTECLECFKFILEELLIIYDNMLQIDTTQTI